ncbi:MULTISPECIES: site-specific integrase [unclassified Rathayibacter]|uniref:tyrosine-type recombinase/integrase n=1 Tax=unclassified Rathayibacter TaxID=2609250 RepID=UPI0014046E26|nr:MULTISPECIES: site-specific integrase [unclassified Rathayibacter]
MTPRLNPGGSMSWRVQYRIDGQMKQRTFKDARAAEQFGRRVDSAGPRAAEELEFARRQPRKQTVTFAEFACEYLDAKSGMLTGIEPGTRDGYESIVRRSFLPVLGQLVLEDITRRDIGRWVAWQESQPSGRTPGVLIAPKTVRNYHALLSSILGSAVQQKLIEDNPAFKVRLSRGRSREGVFLSRQEFATLLHFVPEYYKPLVSFLAGTGVRWGEATALTWGDVELSATPPTVRIDKAWKKGNVIGPPKSDRSRRTVSLAAELVMQLGSSRAGDVLLFAGQGGGRLWYGSFKTRIWDRAVAAANDPERCAEAGLQPIGKRPNPHDCRHTHASWLIAANVPMPYVQARLGHEKITTTVDIYGHLMPAAHAEMAAVMDDVMRSIGEFDTLVARGIIEREPRAITLG